MIQFDLRIKCDNSSSKYLIDEIIKAIIQTGKNNSIEVLLNPDSIKHI